jgi:uncharacterized protein YeeX (DUF496 family)
MPEGLKLQVEAEVQQAVKALANDIPKAADKAETSLTNLQKQVAAFGGGVTRALNTTSLNFNKLPSVINPAEKALNSFSKTSSQATAASINLGRVIQDAPFGFIGIANNLNPLIESFQRLKASTGTTGGALKALAGSLAGPGGLGIAISAASSLLIVFGDAIFGAKNRVEGFNFELEQLSQQASRVKESIESFTTQLEFLKKIGSLTVDINFGSGFTGDLLKLQQASVAADNELYKLTQSAKEFQRISDQTSSLLFGGGVSSSTIQAIGQIGSLREVPDDLIEKFSKSDQAIVKSAKKAAQDLYDIQVEIGGARNNRVLAQASIRALRANQEREEVKKALEKSKEDYKKYVDDTIAEAKRISDFTKNMISLKLAESFFDTRSDKFRNALSFLKEYRLSNFKIIISPSEIDITPPTSSTVLPNFSEGINIFQKEIDAYFKENPVDISLVLAVQDATLADKKMGFLSSLFGQNTVFPKIPEFFKKAERSAIQFASVLNDILQPAFKNMFDSILQGEQPLKAFFQGLGNAVAQLIQKLVSAAITAAILSSIFPGGLGTVKGFGGFFKSIIGFAAGGIVSGPTLAMIGEGAGTSRSNPEVVAPLDQLRSILGDVGGGGSQNVYVTGKLRGYDMVLQQERTSRGIRRTTGRR